ncbi:unnamed protein product [Clonostachys rosea]|uniref:ZZ-type domain-containing protein n=1 Tax=Bionectria ochroleuca TaxID=29856 RepID=A0ABY6TZT1_BIOOC|nr:unnamed protein product [Clonostachys rosea]
MASIPRGIDGSDVAVLARLMRQALELDAQGADEPVLTWAVRHGNVELVRHLLDEGHAVQGTEFWPLPLAASLGYCDIIKLLLDRGADVHQRDPFLGDAIEAAAIGRHPAAMRVLCEAGARVDDVFIAGGPILHHAIELGDPELVRLLARSGADIVEFGSSGFQSPLTRAVGMGSIEMVATLLELGADQEASLEHGQMPLVLAARNDEVEIMRLLLDHGWEATELEEGIILLHGVVSQGNLEAARLLLEKGIDAGGLSQGLAALHIAALRGNVDIAELLLANGADLEVGDEERQTSPLCTAVLARQHQMVEYLLKRGANPVAQTTDGATSISLAAFAGSMDLLRLMFEYGRDKEGMTSERARIFPGAVVAGNMELIELLLDSGVDADHLFPPGWTALHIAVDQGHVGLARLLLDRGADIERLRVVAEGHCNPLGLAMHAKNFDMVSLLLDRGANPRAKQGSFRHTPLHICCRDDQPELARLLLDRGADPSEADIHGMTAMHFAAASNSASCIRYWADPSAVGSRQSTPLSFAICSNHKEAVKTLIELGADLNIVQSQSTYLGLATREPSMVELLIELGADVSLLDSAGRTALHAAATLGHLEAARVLLERGANVNSGDRFGYTPLAAAAGRGHGEVVRLLLDRGADPTVPSKTSPSSCGWMPLHGPVCCGNTQALVQLVDAVGVHNLPTNLFGRSLVFFAVAHGRCDAVKLLIEMDENQPQLRDMYGSSPLGMAVRLGHEGIAQLLFNASRPSLDAEDLLGKSIRWWLANAATPSMQELLQNLEAGMSPRKANDRVTHYEPRSGGHCDICLRKLTSDQPRHQCKVCAGGGFNSCVQCVKEGGKCLDPSHELLYHATSLSRTPS